MQRGVQEVLRAPEAVAAAGVATCLLAPALEELIYRGFFLPSLTRYLSVPAAVRSAADPFTMTGSTLSQYQPRLSQFGASLVQQ